MPSLTKEKINGLLGFSMRERHEKEICLVQQGILLQRFIHKGIKAHKVREEVSDCLTGRPFRGDRCHLNIRMTCKNAEKFATRITAATANGWT